MAEFEIPVLELQKQLQELHRSYYTITQITKALNWTK